jgi:hypothetical protein
MKIIQDGGGYTKDERLTYKNVIYSNCIGHIKHLVEAGGMDVENLVYKVAYVVVEYQ